MRDHIAIYDKAVIVIRDGLFAFVGTESDIGQRTSFEHRLRFRRARRQPPFPVSSTRTRIFHSRVTARPSSTGACRARPTSRLAATGGGSRRRSRTAAASQEELVDNILGRALARWHGTERRPLRPKSGYGLSVEGELKQLRAIRDANQQSPVRLIPTCLGPRLSARGPQQRHGARRLRLHGHRRDSCCRGREKLAISAMCSWRRSLHE